MSQSYKHLGEFSDWVVAAQEEQALFPVAKPGHETQQRIRDVLSFRKQEQPKDVRLEQTWERDGVRGERVSWSVGYGPRTEAYVLKPTGATGKLPAVIALHDHGGFKYFGKEKIADGPEEAPQILQTFREQYYGNRAYATALAKEGFAVLVPDVFLWGSRKFALETMPEYITELAHQTRERDDTDIDVYNRAASHHEHIVEKYCTTLGTTLAAVVSHEDRIAFNYLLSRDDVVPNKIACIGLSGGGMRAAFLQATHDQLAAAAIIALMSTYPGLLDHNIANHTWMFYPHSWSRYGDYPDIAACRAPRPLFIQYALGDQLFTQEGMKAAHERIAGHYASLDSAAYHGEFYGGGHEFNLEMQGSAFAWLKKILQ